ncbi:MAG: stage III sporulation protein AE [Clostridiales bacterium]|nr:stage III sporulation protein AE [Clostridiales bacterium]
MKLRTVIILILIFIICLPAIAHADVVDDLEDNVQEGLGSIDFSQVDDVAEDFIGSVADKVQSIINGEFDSAESFWQVIGLLFAQTIKELLPELISIFVVLVILGLIRRTSGGLISESTDSVVSFVGVTVVLLSVLSMVVDCYKQVYQMLAKVSLLAEVTSPILLTLLIANGGNAASSVCQPSMVMFSTGIIEIIKNVVLPLSIFALVFAAVSNISTNVRVSKASSFLNNSAGWVLGIVFMLFSAVTTVQGISAASIDGVSFRAAKFATKNYIPILGGYLADGFDIVVASTTLIKNAFGVVSLLILLFMMIQPLVAILSVNLGLQAVAALSEPIVDSKYVKILGGVSKSLTFLSVLVLAVSFMFCIMIFIAICCANGV